MRKFVEIPGGKVKRVHNRLDGDHKRRRNDENDDGFDRPRHDHRHDRRAARQSLRNAAFGEVEDDSYDDRDGAYTYVTDDGAGEVTIHRHGDGAVSAHFRQLYA